MTTFYNSTCDHCGDKEHEFNLKTCDDCDTTYCPTCEPEAIDTCKFCNSNACNFCFFKPGRLSHVFNSCIRCSKAVCNRVALQINDDCDLLCVACANEKWVNQ